MYGIGCFSTSTISSLNMFKKKLVKARNSKKDKLEVTPNFAGRPKYFVPAITEWYNNTYTYNNNTSKLLPIALKVTFRLIKSYFNIYSRKLENKIRSRPLRIRARRLSTNRMLISRPELKHTNDKVFITTYLYNRQKTYYLNKILKIASQLPSSKKIKTIRKKTLKISSKVEKHRNFALKILNVKNKKIHNLFNRYDIWMDRTATYDEIYSRKKTLQNTSIENMIFDSLPLQVSDRQHFKELEENDILEYSLCKTDQDDSRMKLKNFRNYPMFRKNTVLKLVKHKNVSGIRIEVAGRLTRRNKADRSVFKLKYKGNIRNMDSSYKGLPTVLLRGFAKSNLQYSNLKSKIRIGSFGLKGWVSSN
uniref:Ribosomal protein S3 n=1 Tax=Lecanora strobilina TaxID=1518595 RepID=A0A166AUE0_9LECA|nr:Ribosomal protein S3 [Lecanora strobilina]AMZ84236.1 ribosomal protein S3 [Lecanora strobilina]